MRPESQAQDALQGREGQGRDLEEPPEGGHARGGALGEAFSQEQAEQRARRLHSLSRAGRPFSAHSCPGPGHSV